MVFSMGRIVEWLLSPLMLFVKSKLTKEFESFSQYFNSNRPYSKVVYVFHKSSAIDRMALSRICKEHHLPQARALLSRGHPDRASYLPITIPGLFRTYKFKRAIPELKQFISQKSKNPSDKPILFVPVSVIWGRNPGKTEDSFLKLLFFDDFNAGFFQKLVVTIVQGRANHVHFGEPYVYEPERDMSDRDIDQQVKKIQRIFRIHFWQKRNAILGPKLYNRYSIVRKITQSKAIQGFINDNAANPKVRRKMRSQARRYIEEITSDISFPVVRFFAVILNKLWNTLFDGVEIGNIERVKNYLNSGHELIFLPNHRSHLDYLLVNYSLHKNDIQVPHTAAGINLNFWPIGPLLRRAGAFFIRRRFSGNKLYTAICQEYLTYIIKNGYPLSFFVEGGRSRHGRLLKPKLGMLSMMLKGLKGANYDKAIIIPVNISYDRVIEIRSYLKELRGHRKASESFKQLLNARKHLRNHFGKARINFGEAIKLDDYLANYSADRQDGKQESVAQLGDDLMVRIQQLAPITPVSVTALCLLSHPSRAIGVEDLVQRVAQIRRYFDAIGQQENISEPYTKDTIAAIEKLDGFSRFKHPGGDVIYLTSLQASYQGYYKNNIYHYFALPSLICQLIKASHPVSATEIEEVVATFIPFIDDDFFTEYAEVPIKDLVATHLSALVSLGIISHDSATDRYLPPPTMALNYRALVIWSSYLKTYFERYTLLAQIVSSHHQGGKIAKTELFDHCQKIAQKVAILEGIGHHESLNISLYKDGIPTFVRFGLLTIDSEATYGVTSKAFDLARHAGKIMSSHLVWELKNISANTDEDQDPMGGSSDGGASAAGEPTGSTPPPALGGSLNGKAPDEKVNYGQV